MKLTILLTAIAIIMFSCNQETSESTEKETDTNNVIEISIIEEPEDKRENKFEFNSVIRPDEFDLSLENRYVDELIFIEYNADSYFTYSSFLTETGDTVVLLHNDSIDNSNSGKLMKVLWEIGGFYEPGDAAEIFYKESLISYEIIDE